jgi:hypothetical protein
MSSPLNSETATDFGPVAALFSDLDLLIQSVAKGRMPGLEPITLKMPIAQPAIHAFYTMVSWTYVCLIESGPVHFRFLSERAAALGIDPNNGLQTFREDVHALRTVLQHNLDLADANDFAKLGRCEKWMASVLERRPSPGDRFWPSQEHEWLRLAGAMREQARRFAELNIATVGRLMRDEYAEDAIDEWILRCNRVLPAHEFDRIAGVAAGDLGLEHLDTTRVRKVHLEEWNRRLRLLPDGADIRRESRRLVEQTLLAEADSYLPITGEDVIGFLGVRPGPDVGMVLRKAKDIYRKDPCSREDLLRRLSMER